MEQYLGKIKELPNKSVTASARRACCSVVQL